MTSAEISALLMLATVSSFTPGPNTTLSSAIAANLGLRRALPFVLAVPMGWGLLLTLCATGLGGLVLAWPALRGAIVLAGTVYLLWLARRLWGTRQWAHAEGRRLYVGFFQGLGLQFLNIKAWMLALAVVGGWVAGHHDATQRTLTLLPIMMSFGLASNLSYAVTGAVLRQWLAQGQRLRNFNRSMSVALVLTVMWLLFGLRHSAL